MSRHMLLLPAPEAEWALLPPEEHEKGMRSHEQFHRDLAAGGHRVAVAGPLTPSAQAVSMRPDGSGGVLVTDGPFAEVTEQVGGFYQVETDDLDDLVDCCQIIAAVGDGIEVRRTVSAQDRA